MQRGVLQEHTELPVEAVLLPRTLTRFNSRIAFYGPLWPSMALYAIMKSGG